MIDLDVKSLLGRAHDQGLGDGFLPFWAGMLAEVLVPIQRTAKVLEIGTTSPKFMQVVNLAFPYQSGLGVILEVDNISGFESWPVADGIQCSFMAESGLCSETREFDLAFSHEVFSYVPDLVSHAKLAWRLIAPGGVYYAAVGWHGDNPHLSRQVKMRADKGLPFYSHSLDSIAATFHEVGFEVGYKRLPLPYFMIYDPVLVGRRFGTVAEMIPCLQDHKILFSLRKGGGDHAKL